MSERKNAAILAGFALAVCLIAASLSAALTARHMERLQFQALSAVCGRVVESQPDAERAVLSAVRDWSRFGRGAGADFLARLGYEESSFAGSGRTGIFPFAAAGFFAGAALFALTCAAWRQAVTGRLRALAEALERVNLGRSGALLQNREGALSQLQDEIYKTVASLRQTRDDALEAKRNFAENLANIAHQLKTPVTSISLALQGLRERDPRECAAQMREQLARLTHMEEALLLLARVDAGALPLSREEVDVFTVLTLAADNLREIARRREVSVEIPELGEARICADLEWTMEAIMNLMKNCIEHAPAGSAVHCSYEQNPISTMIRIWDEGPGFSQRDIPRLFERFYRGESAAPGGIGIGLALAREILEMQDGTVRAENRPGGGARFEIRFYSHQTVTFA